VLRVQTEIAKRLNAICAQIIPFLSQEVRHLCVLPVHTVAAAAAAAVAAAAAAARSNCVFSRQRPVADTV